MTLDNAKSWQLYLVVLLVAGAIYLGCSISPPSLMDDVDAVHAEIARTMLATGDWVTPHLDGVAYLEKPPLGYWAIAISFKFFGIHDFAARLPTALSAMALAWLTAAFGIWAFGKRAGLYAGLCMATCIGVFLFTRILLPDVTLTFTITLALWAFLRVLDEGEGRPRLWSIILATSLGTGLLLKSLIGMVFPLAAGFLYLFFTRQLLVRRTWSRLHPLSGAAIILLIAAPWHILATLHNPPCFALTLHSGPGEYHGFLWFFFINEQLLRFLGLRYPHDYNTVPRLYFWLFHLLWLFPWSVYFPAIARLSYRAIDRAARTRLLALCWAGFILVFFTFSTTQEYYSMPAYPAMALLLGSAMAEDRFWVRHGSRILALIAGCAAVACLALLFVTRSVPTPGDISSALTSNPSAYTLSLGHMEDLTINSFAYLRLPLGHAALAFAIGAIGVAIVKGEKKFFAAVLMMVLFFHAARLAMIVFDPYLSSRPLANAILQAPQGTLIVDHNYYDFSSVFFYTDRSALLLNGKYHNLEYGAYAPGAPDVFIDDSRLQQIWPQAQRYYLVADGTVVPHLESLVGREQITLLKASGGKVVMTNHSLASAP